MALVMVRYKLRPDAVERNLELLRALHDELASTRPDGLRYASYQLDDDVSVVELVESGGEGRLAALAAFRRYREGIDERCDEPPVLTELREVGAFRFPLTPPAAASLTVRAPRDGRRPPQPAARGS